MKNEKPTTSGLKEKIGQVVKQMRDERGLSQDQLGEKIGTDKGNVSRMENKGQGTIERLGKIARTLGVQVTDIIAQAEGRDIGEKIDPQSISVPLLNAVGSMGIGIDQHEDIVIRQMNLTRSWVRETLNTTAENLAFIHSTGDSMSPTVNSGDILLVDTSIKDAISDGVYVLSAHNRLFIKRVQQRLDGVFEVSSDNPGVKTVSVLNGDHDVEVVGRALWVWNGKKL